MPTVEQLEPRPLILPAALKQRLDNQAHLRKLPPDLLAALAVEACLDMLDGREGEPLILPLMVTQVPA